MVGRGAIVALAGRRIDAHDADEVRFPLVLVPDIRKRMVEEFGKLRPAALVCSAACGADLIALEVALAEDIPFYILLPFERRRFKETSVTDRPGDWGPLYDRVIHEAVRVNRLFELADTGEGDEAYTKATQAIVKKAIDVASSRKITAIAVTDNNPRTSHDATAEFLKLSIEAGFEPLTIQIPKAR